MKEEKKDIEDALIIEIAKQGYHPDSQGYCGLDKTIKQIEK